MVLLTLRGPTAKVVDVVDVAVGAFSARKTGKRRRLAGGAAVGAKANGEESAFRM